MAWQFIFLTLLAVSPVLMLAVHAIFSRLSVRIERRPPNRMVAALSILAALPPMAALAWFGCLCRLNPDSRLLWAVLYGLLVYVCLGYCYFHLFSMSESARRIQILHVIMRDGPITREKFAERYGVGDMLEARLKRLEMMGEIERRGELYLIRRRWLLRSAKLLVAWSRLLGYNPGAMLF